MSNFAVLSILLGITAFYVFLAIYLIFHIVSEYFFSSRGRRTSS